MLNRLSSRASLPRRAANLFLLASLAATSPVVSGCSADLQLGDESGEGGGPDVSTGGDDSGGPDSSTGGGGPESSGSGAGGGPDSSTGGGGPESSGSGAGGGPDSSTGGGGPESSGSGAGGGPDSSTGGGTPGELADPGFALFNEQITTVTPLEKQAWLDAGESLDPQTLILVLIEAGAPTCSDPVFDHGGSQNEIQTLIGLPPSLQRVGRYDLSSTDVIAYRYTWLTDGMGNGGGGGRPITEGAIEVVSIDDAVITVRLSGSDSDGDHVAQRCP
ncbi:hypothetical protein WME76_00860 [Sorangium sp. So ce119]|uniref:hypothetical protein n=1 Tax=Sorangium sp. So ce119 TaxID=3133279 RepID=UPI003F5FC808